MMVQPRQDDLRQEKQRYNLHRHQRQRLHLHIGCSATLDAPHPEHDHQDRIGQCVPERRPGGGGNRDPQDRSGIEVVEPVGQVVGETADRTTEFIEVTARFPIIQSHAEQQEASETEGAPA